MTGPGLLEAAMDCHRHGRFAEAERLYREILAADPENSDALHLLGVLAHQHGQNEMALALITQAIAQNPVAPAFHDHLGQILRQLGRMDEAAAAFRRALAVSPGFVDALCNLANLLAGSGRLGEVEEHFRRGLEAEPDNAALRYNMGLFLSMSGRLDDAVAAFTSAVALDPTMVDAHNNLGEIHRNRGRPDLAEACYRVGLERMPDHVQCLNNLGNALRAMGRHLEAVRVLHRAMAVDPSFAPPYSNLGSVLQELGRNAEAIAHFRRAAEMNPALSVARSNVILASSYLDGMTGAALRAEAEQWDRQMGIRPMALPAQGSTDHGRRLSIGYLSGDFRDHAAGFFLEALLTHHDRSRFQVFCYATDLKDDAVTARMRATDSHWRPVHGLADMALAQTIRADGIDILLDCSGHSAGNRLGAVALRPAPVQIALGPLGHGGTTGLSAMDYWIGDPHIAPDGTEAEFSETLVRLPRLFAPFALRSTWPDVAALPRGDLPVIGCVADPARLTDRTVALWRRVLDLLPGAQLILKHNAYTNPVSRGYWQERFNPLGDACILEGIPGGWGEHMADFYGRVWFLFDGFPGTGATSAIIPLWMGVPLVTMTGGHAGERYSASILANVGLADLVGRGEGEFVEAAVALAGDRARLGRLRGDLRDMVRASAIGDPAGVTREMEAAYDRCWRQWCQSQGRVTDAGGR